MFSCGALQVMPQKVLLLHVLPPGVVVTDPVPSLLPLQHQQHQLQQHVKPSCSSSGTTASSEPASDQGADDTADTSGQQAAASVPTPLQPFLQQLGAFSAAWGQQPEGWGMPPPLDMPALQRAQSIVGGPRVLWWWPCRPLDRVNDLGGMNLSKCSMLGLDSSTAVAVSIWGLAPAHVGPSGTQATTPLHPQATSPMPLTVMDSAAATADAPNDSGHTGADMEAQEYGPAAAELAALAHDRVPGAWQQLCSFRGALYVKKSFTLGTRKAVQCLKEYPGWHMLRAELVRTLLVTSHVCISVTTSWAGVFVLWLCCMPVHADSAR
jgi:hypothetical protein